jgi:hypothetical protein
LKPCAISFASSLLRLSVHHGAGRKENTMTQLLLFPPPSSPSAPLPGTVRSEAKNLLASLLIAVAGAKKPPPREGDGHE